MLTSNSHVSEEKPASNEGFLGAPWRLLHDVHIRRVEAKGCGRESISHQVYPQQLYRDQGLRDAKSSCQEDTETHKQKNKQCYYHAIDSDDKLKKHHSYWCLVQTKHESLEGTDTQMAEKNF